MGETYSLLESLDGNTTYEEYNRLLKKVSREALKKYLGNDADTELDTGLLELAIHQNFFGNKYLQIDITPDRERTIVTKTGKTEIGEVEIKRALERHFEEYSFRINEAMEKIRR